MEGRKNEAIHRNSVSRSLDSIDIAKFLGSILIFAMHCSALGDYKNAQSILEILARWGVPFFFISSSYFLFRKGDGGNIERKQLFRYLFRIGMLYLCWLIFNLPSIYIIRLYNKNLASVKIWLNFIKNSFLSSTFTGSWYLVSCIFSACFVYWLSKRFRAKTVLLLTAPFYIICVFSSVYKGACPHQLSYILGKLCFPLNIFNGCFYFSLGKYIAENEHVLTKYLTKTRALLLFVVFYALYVVELFAAKHFHLFASTDVAFTTFALSCSLFIVCLQTKISCKNSILLRKLSVIIFCCQSNVLIFNRLCKIILGGYSIIAFILSCMIVAVISIMILAAQKRSRWKWVNYMT